MEKDDLRRRSIEVCQTEESPQNSDSAVLPGVYFPKNKSQNRLQQKSCRNNERSVFKNGEFNIDKSFSTKIFISDWFVTMVDARWRWTLLNFFMMYTIDWLFFGLVYWIIALNHGDLNGDHLYPNQNDTLFVPCIENIYGFTSAFLFSVEVHTTVAYGRRAITLECPHAILVMCLQCILSSIFQAFMVGILFAKLTRPKARTETILFSKNAVVHLRDEILCMVFRVGDMRKSRILNIKASAYVIQMQNAILSDDFQQIELKTELDGCESTFFLWPVSVIHVIDKNSPLYNLSAADFLCGHLEVLAVFEGIIESTGQPVQARSSYTENDVLWGHRLVNMIEFDTAKEVYEVDFSKLSVTEKIDTPLCSAAEYVNAISIAQSIIEYQDYDKDAV